MPELPEEVQMCYSKRIGQFMFDRVKQKKAVLYEGAAETLNYLKEKGYQLIYLSNCGAEYMKIHTECFGLKNYFSQMYCSGDYDFQPKYEIFNVIREACPGEYLVVGDRFQDVYKRQVYKKQYTYLNEKIKFLYFDFVESIVDNQYCITPVSYTHLDVYKRQGR